jgi:DNA end-binding protein Ku
VVADPRVERRDHEGLALVDESEVADKPLVQDRVDRLAVVDAALGFAPHAGSIRSWLRRHAVSVRFRPGHGLQIGRAGNTGLMPRSIWSGTISFGLVSIPVRMVGAISEHALHFNLLHRKDSSPIGYEKVCKKEGKQVADDEIVKAYEVSKGKYVEVEDADFEAARVEGYHTFEISDFVAVDEIDAIYFERSYYLVPQDGGEKVYTLLVRAMEDAGLAAVGTFVMREREHLGCLRIRDGVVTLERMYFADEIRPADELRPERARLNKQELEMAAALIDRFKGSFDPSKYSDTYTEKLLDVIKRKQKGETVTVEEPEAPEEEAPDLMEALKASIEAHSAARRKAPTRRSPRRTSSGRRSSRSRSRR